MGNLYLQHLGGNRLFNCRKCSVFLSNDSQIESKNFTASSGRAYLFKKTVNMYFSEVLDREMMTGRHKIRHAHCKKCHGYLGWKYEFAYKDNQRYKEGKVVLEVGLLVEKDGIEGEIKN